MHLGTELAFLHREAVRQRHQVLLAVEDAEIGLTSFHRAFSILAYPRTSSSPVSGSGSIQVAAADLRVRRESLRETDRDSQAGPLTSESDADPVRFEVLLALLSGLADPHQSVAARVRAQRARPLGLRWRRWRSLRCR